MTDFSEFKKVYQTAQTLVCPIRHTLMVHPVLISNGRTYERSAIQEFFEYQHLMDIRPICDDLRQPLDNLHMVPHDTLKNIIEQFVKKYENFQLPSGISVIEDEQTPEEKTVLYEWMNLLDLCNEYRTKTTEDINIEEEFEKVYQTAQTLICPISKHLMVEPVTISNGKTYDRFEIRSFFIARANARLQCCDPITFELLSSPTFIPDNSMDTLTKQFVTMYQDKKGQEWEPVVEYCNVYNAKIIEEARKLQEEEIKRQRREREERDAHILRTQREARLYNRFSYRPRDAARREQEARQARRQEALRQEQEAPRQEQEALRQEALERMAARQEAPRQEAPRQEALRQVALRQEAPRQEALRQVALRQVALRQEAPRQVALRQEAPRQVARALLDDVNERIAEVDARRARAARRDGGE